MTTTPVESRKHRVITAASWIIAGLALFAASLAEASPGPEIRGDGDNPADSLRYLATAGRAYLWSGALLGVGGAALITGAVGRLRARGGHPESMLMHVALVATIVVGALMIGAGAIRMQATGTVPHIESLDPAWGEAAYLAVQMAGTQGMLSAGVFTMLVVTVALSIAEWRSGMRAPLFVAALPAVALIVLLSDLFVPGFESAMPEFVFPVYFVSALLGIPLWCAAYGVSQLVAGRAAARGRELAS
jgi:hypothetical protein